MVRRSSVQRLRRPIVARGVGADLVASFVFFVNRVVERVKNLGVEFDVKPFPEFRAGPVLRPPVLIGTPCPEFALEDFLREVVHVVAGFVVSVISRYEDGEAI